MPHHYVPSPIMAAAYLPLRPEKMWNHKIFFNKVERKKLITLKMQILWVHNLSEEGRANEPKLITFFGAFVGKFAVLLSVVVGWIFFPSNR